ncbi:MAG TPA: hypothetical protein PKC93_07260, partial [Candidatus Obscuribacter sp.]|nr:hypothetical protein [Candidatus Obscuribacter sp.]
MTVVNFGGANLTGLLKLALCLAPLLFAVDLRLCQPTWGQSETKESLKKYQDIYSKYNNKIYSDINSLQESIEQDIGKVIYPNIGWGIREPSKNNRFITDYEKIYQESRSAFNKVRTLYEKFEK